MATAAEEWARCKQYIKDALEYAQGTHSIEDIEEGIEKGQFQFWPGVNCAAITEVITYPRKRVLNFFLLGGDLDELLNDMEPVICEWAKFVGCQGVMGSGRKGFSKVLLKKGYFLGFTTMCKDLT